MNILAARRPKGSTWVYVLGTCALLVAALIPAVATAVAPNSPGGLTAVRGTQPPVIASLAWTAPDDTEVDYYRVVAATSPSGPFASEAIVQTTSFEFVDGLGGIDYYFLVTAVDTEGRESGAASVGPVSAAWADSPHEASSLGSSRCLGCHSVHAAGTATLLRQEHSEDGRGAQCTSCHDGRVAGAANVTSGTVDSFGLASGHSLEATTSGGAMIEDCYTCHDTHATTEDGRMLPAKKINGTEISSAGVGLCLSCHDADDSWAGAGYPDSSAPSRDASGFPVAGTWTGPDTYLSANTAHRLIAEATQTVEATDPVRREQGDCRYCHTAHGSANYDGLRAPYTVPSASTLASDQADGSSAALCYTCHGGTTPEGFTAAPGTDIKQFSTLEATSSAGHTIVTAGGTLPVGAPLPCFECHNPHGSSRGNASQISDERGGGLSTDTAGGVRSFCFTCHTTSDTAAGWDSGTSSYEVPASEAEVVGLPRSGALLRLPPNAAHEQGDGRSCYECHGDDYAAGGRNVHNPANGAVEVAGVLPSEPSTVTVDPSQAPTSTVDTTLPIDAGDLSLDATASTGGSGTIEPPAAEATGEQPAASETIEQPAASEEASSPLIIQISEAIVGFFSALG